MNREGRKAIKGIQAQLSDLQANIRAAEDISLGYGNRLTLFSALVSDIVDLQSEISDLCSDEEGKLDNLSESLRDGPTGEAIQNAFENLESAASQCDDVTGECEDAVKALSVFTSTETMTATDDEIEDWAQNVSDAIQDVIDFLEGAAE